MITLITDKIGIGDSDDGKQLPKAFDATLNVAVDLDIPTIGNEKRHKVGLLDGPGNDEFLLMSAVLLLHSLNRKYSRVLVHCQAGTSRSVMVVSAYVAIIGGMEFDKVLNDVMAARKVDQYRPALYQQFQQLIPTLRKLIRP
jgi:protein-tyrosine phosphatase